MGQVPSLSTAPLGIVGDGRAARHFHHYFDLLSLPVRGWSRRASDRSPDEVLAPCDTVLVLIADTAIEPFIAAWPALTRHRLVHGSGSLVTSAAECAHPLMTFGPDLYDLARNLIADGSRALTGPLVRGDAATIAANLTALEGDPFREVYSAFATWRMSRDAGSVQSGWEMCGSSTMYR
jgi:Domain of unknown function (DUF2520)